MENWGLSGMDDAETWWRSERIDGVLSMFSYIMRLTSISKV
jgi:hypothetical protein